MAFAGSGSAPMAATFWRKTTPQWPFSVSSRFALPFGFAVADAGLAEFTPDSQNVVFVADEPAVRQPVITKLLAALPVSSA